MPLADHWNIGSTELLMLDLLRDELTGDWIDDATVAAQVTDGDGDNVGGAITMSYIAGTNGKYAGSIPASVTGAMTAGAQYTATITATGGAGTGVWKITKAARQRAI